jgi:hypothetical protein
MLKNHSRAFWVAHPEGSRASPPKEMFEHGGILGGTGPKRFAMVFQHAFHNRITLTEVRLHKKSAQLVQTNRYKAVQLFPQSAQAMGQTIAYIRLVPHLLWFIRHRAHATSHITHSFFGRLQSVNYALCTLSTLPTITVTIFIYKSRGAERSSI